MPATAELDIRERRGIGLRATSLLAAVALGVGGTTAEAINSQADQISPDITTTVGPVHVDNIVTKTASARAVVKADLTKRVVLAYRSATGTPAKEVRGKKCFIDTDIWNSGAKLGQTANNPVYFRDQGKLNIICKNDRSPSGYVKVGVAKNRNVLKDGFQKKRDIIPGSDCHNIVKPGGKRPRKTVVNPILVRTFSEQVKLDLAAQVSARADCGNGTFAYSSAEARVQTSLKISSILRGRLSQLKEEFVAKEKVHIGLSAFAQCSSGGGTVPENHNPVISIVNPQHIFVNGEQQVCAYANDPDGMADVKTVIWSKKGDINFTSFDYPGNEPGEHCTRIKAGVDPGVAELTAQVVDQKGAVGSDTTTFPIASDSFGQPGAF